MPTIERYWAEADPEHLDGEGTESFAMLLERVSTALDRLATLPAESLVYVFSHGQFIQAVRSFIVDSELTDREKMRKFWGTRSPAIANAELVELSFDAGIWRHLPANVPIA